MSLHPWHSSPKAWRLLHGSTPGWEIKTTTVSSSPSCVFLITEIDVPYSNNKMVHPNKEQMLIIVNICSVTHYSLCHNTGEGPELALWPHSSQRGNFLFVFHIQAYSEGKLVVILDATLHLHQLYKIMEMSSCTAEAVQLTLSRKGSSQTHFYQ